nr:ketopantoate hydroxymethyltransferase [Paenibacillus pasadenensis]
MNDVAQYVHNRIAKVSLNNGAVQLSEFTLKQVSGGVVELRYYIPEGSVATVSKIELLDGSGAVLSSNSVTIPITTDTLMVQSITVQEV